jgi:hypothetical protein
MKKEQKICFIAFAISFFMIGFAIGTLFNDYTISNSGIYETSYCKEIQIDTLQYNYQKDMYKYQIKIIK